MCWACTITTNSPISLHNAKSHKDNSHAIHSLNMYRTGCKWNEINRLTANTKWRCIMV